MVESEILFLYLIYRRPFLPPYCPTLIQIESIDTNNNNKQDISNKCKFQTQSLSLATKLLLVFVGLFIPYDFLCVIFLLTFP